MAETIANASFGLLNNNQKHVVYGFFKARTSKTPIKTLIATEFTTAKTASPTLAWYADRLLKTDPASFQFLTPSQREALFYDLMLAYYQLCGNYQANVNERRRQDLDLHFAKLEHCAELIEILQGTKKQITEKPSTQTLWDEFIAKLRHISSGKTVYIRKWMCDLNVWRLYWVWAGNLLRTVLKLLPENFHHKNKAQLVTTAPQVFLGYVSWALYYARFLVHFLLLLKHTIAGPWMSKEEKDIAWQKRLNQQWQERKFKLINDFIWATTNLITFYWLVGNGLLGYVGNLLTVGLLLGDALLTKWRHQETQDEIARCRALYQQEIQLLKDKQTALAADPMTNQAQIDLLVSQQARLVRALKQFEFDAAHRQRAVNADLAYASVLLVSFSVMCSCLLPETIIAGSSLAGTVFALSGGALCFLVSLIYSVYSNYIEVTKAQDSQHRALLECKEILKTGRDLTELECLRYQQLRHEIDMHRQMERYQYYTFARAAIVESLIPLVVFSAFTFLPFGAGIAVFASGAAIAGLLHLWIEQKKPNNNGFAATEKQIVHKADSLKHTKEERQAMLAREIEPALKRTAISANGLSRFFHTPPEAAEVMAGLSATCGG